MIKYFFFILSILLLTSCEKELEFNYHTISPQIVIEGLLDRDGIKVSLAETTPMSEKIESTYLTDGLVTLTDQTNKSSVTLEPDSNGVYSSEYSGIIGHKYLLEVKRDGKIYSSECEMRPAVTIFGLMFQWIKMPYDYVAVLQITFEALSGEDLCYWIKVYRNGEPYKWIMSDNSSASNGIINEVIMTSRKNLEEEDEKDILREGDEVIVSINTISRSMYDYLTAISNDSNGPSMFQGDFCLGYFLASAISSDTIIFHPDEITQYK